MIENIEWRGQALALIVRETFNKEGVNFVTSTDNALQLGVLQHHSGVKIKPHTHNASTKVINNIQEVLHIEYGKIEVDFYDDEGHKISNAILNTGDTILLISGGHGFNILEESKIVEIKQGPYEGVAADKTLLDIYDE